MLKFFAFILMVMLAIANLPLAGFCQVTYKTVPLTGFNHDIIANGAAEFLPTSSTTMNVDGVGHYLMSQDYYSFAIPHTSGIPNNGLISNKISGYSALNYQLANFNANNALQLKTKVSGRITFATPTTAAEVYVLAVSGTSLTTPIMTINYADGTKTDFTSLPSFPDWYTTAPSNVFGMTGRSSNTIPVSTPYESNGNAPFFSQIKLTVPLNKIRVAISSIDVTNDSNTGVMNIMAVSVGTYPPCAVPTSAEAKATTTLGGATALTSACPTSTIYLSLANENYNPEKVYVWQSSTDQTTWTDIAGANSLNCEITGQTTATYYRCKIACANNSNFITSSAVLIGQNIPTNCYCLPTYATGGSNDCIANVSMGTLLNNTSSLGNPSPYYRNYSATQNAIPNLARNKSTSLSVTFGSDGNQYSAVWIDFNQNGSFETNEYFSGGRSSSNETKVIEITVPPGALLGNTRMRIRGGDDVNVAADKSCGASGSSYGEAEDYLVNIVDSPSATISSTAGTSGATTYTSPVPFSITFSKPVTGLLADEILITNGTIKDFSGSGISYNLTVIPTATGLVTINVPADIAQDNLSIGNAAAVEFSLNYSSTLPVTLSSFTIKEINDAIKLDWQTNAEFENDYFEVSRSVDGQVFEYLTTVKGHGTTNTKQYYQAFDRKPNLGLNYYRLKQFDHNGVFKELGIKVINFNLAHQMSIVISPNPVSSEVQVTFPKTSHMLEIIAPNGKQVRSVKLSPDATTQILNIGQLTKSVYIVRCHGGYGTLNSKLIKK